MVQPLMRARSRAASALLCAVALGSGGCAVAFAPPLDSWDSPAPQAPSAADAGGTSRWSISIQPDTDDASAENAPAAVAAAETKPQAAPAAPEPTAPKAATPKATAPSVEPPKAAMAVRPDPEAATSVASVVSAPPSTPLPPSPVAAPGAPEKTNEAAGDGLPTYVSPRSKPAHPVEEAQRYVVQPPATGGGESREAGDAGPDDELLDPEYRIGVEDLLDVSVLGEPDLQHVTLRVSPRGTVDFPYAGTIPAAGLSVDEFRGGLVQKLDDYYVAPQVTVFLREYRSRMVHILGEVPRPGPFKLTHRNTLMEVLSRAGGFTPLADKSAVQIIRQDSAGKRVIRVDVNQIIDDGRLDLDIPVESGDVINVPERFF